MTNKAIDKPEFNRDGIYPLFPHYPVNTLWLYIKLFHWHLMKPKMLKKALTVLYTIYTRPKYVNIALNHSKKRYVFFAARFWKKEKVANEWRLAFMEACMRIKELHFEGGFRLRKDITYPEGFEKYVNTKSYNPPEFSRKSIESIVVFNNPAVKDAISWRVAEYLNAGKAIISVPFKMELPKLLLNEQEVLYADNPEQLNDAVNELIENDSRRMALEKKAKMYFDKHCTPEEQIRYILDKANFK
jgi:hypothetical protein